MMIKVVEIIQNTKRNLWKNADIDTGNVISLSSGKYSAKFDPCVYLSPVKVKLGLGYVGPYKTPS